MSFYRKALAFCMEDEEIRASLDWQRDIRFESITQDAFFQEYAWTVIASGFKYRIARTLFEKYKASGYDASVIRHPMKRKALTIGWTKFPEWFKQLKATPEENRLDFLDSLPHIGPVTKYHLAKNIGFDYAKPDVHLERLTKLFGFPDAQKLCAFLSQETGERLAVVDLILWYYCEAKGTRRLLGESTK